MNVPMKILQRLFGVVMLKPDVYREIIENASLWKESAIFIVFAALVNGYSVTWTTSLSSQIIVRSTTPFISWFLFGYLCTFFLKTIYQVNISAKGVMKIYGYVQIFSLVRLLLINWKATDPLTNLLVSMLGYALVILFYIANVIGVREASQVSTGKALVVFFLSFLIILVFSIFYGRTIDALL
jgi:hypothetical protein